MTIYPEVKEKIIEQNGILIEHGKRIRDLELYFAKADAKLTIIEKNQEKLESSMQRLESVVINSFNQLTITKENNFTQKDIAKNTNLTAVIKQILIVITTLIGGFFAGKST